MVRKGFCEVWWCNDLCVFFLGRGLVIIIIILAVRGVVAVLEMGDDGDAVYR